MIASCSFYRTLAVLIIPLLNVATALPIAPLVGTLAKRLSKPAVILTDILDLQIQVGLEVVAVQKGDETPQEALQNVVIDFRNFIGEIGILFVVPLPGPIHAPTIKRNNEFVTFDSRDVGTSLSAIANALGDIAYDFEIIVETVLTDDNTSQVETLIADFITYFTRFVNALSVASPTIAGSLADTLASLVAAVPATTERNEPGQRYTVCIVCSSGRWDVSVVPLDDDTRCQAHEE